MPGLMGDRVKLMIGSTYKIFSNPYVDSLAGYKPAAEAINKVKAILNLIYYCYISEHPLPDNIRRDFTSILHTISVFKMIS